MQFGTKIPIPIPTDFESKNSNQLFPKCSENFGTYLTLVPCWLAREQMRKVNLHISPKLLVCVEKFRKNAKFSEFRKFQIFGIGNDNKISEISGSRKAV